MGQDRRAVLTESGRSIGLGGLVDLNRIEEVGFWGKEREEGFASLLGSESCVGSLGLTEHPRRTGRGSRAKGKGPKFGKSAVPGTWEFRLTSVRSCPLPFALSSFLFLSGLIAIRVASAVNGPGRFD